jgi:hypothetical protein
VKKKRFLKKINKKFCLLNLNQVDANQQISTKFALSANIKIILAIKNNELMIYLSLSICFSIIVSFSVFVYISFFLFVFLL